MSFCLFAQHSMSRLSLSAVVILTALSGVAATSTSPQGFQFVCNNGPCPSGDFQSTCPQCTVIQYFDTATSSLQCNCFNSDLQLQNAVVLPGLQSCTDVEADGTGAINCASSTSTLQNSIRTVLSKKAKTHPPTPSIGGGVKVNFVFNCESGSCPVGPYQSFCPLCSTSGDALSCLCFDAHGAMLLPASVMWNYAKCPTITTTQTGGYLECPSAPASANVQVSSSQ